MRKKINSKLYMTYIVITLMFSLSLVAAFYFLNSSTIKDNAQNNLNQTNQTVLNQIDSHIKQLDIVSTDIVSSTEFLIHFKLILGEDVRPQSDFSEQHSNSILKRILIEALVGQYDIYRISLISLKGDFISTGETNLDSKEVSSYLLNNGWIDNPATVEGGKFLVPPHTDNWLSESSQQVISLIRAINLNGETVGFIELQQKIEVIENILSPQIDGYPLRTILVEDNGNIFFDSVSGNPDINIYDKIRELLRHYRRQTVMYEDGFLNMGLSRYFDWQLALYIPANVVYSSYRFLFVVNFTISLMITAISVLFFSYFIRKITRPILKLVQDFENTNIDNLYRSEYRETNSYEAEVLNKAFDEMVERLSESINERRKLQDLQTKAAFDALQSQIGPHFLYNTLGSIANMCENNDSENAANACYNLTDILRYSSNFKHPIVTLNQEIQTLKAYLYLMKTRYRHRLEYDFIIEESFEHVKMPRLTMQPLVENAIKYSLLEQEVVSVVIKISRFDNFLIIKVEDNGKGISQHELNKIEKRLFQLYSNIENENSEIVNIGGAGLIGTIVRLKIFYGADFRYILASSQNGGAKIELYIPLEDQ